MEEPIELKLDNMLTKLNDLADELENDKYPFENIFDQIDRLIILEEEAVELDRSAEEISSSDEKRHFEKLLEKIENESETIEERFYVLSESILERCGEQIEILAAQCAQDSEDVNLVSELEDGGELAEDKLQDLEESIQDLAEIRRKRMHGAEDKLTRVIDSFVLSCEEALQSRMR